MNKQKFKGVAMLNGDTMATVAKALGIAESSLSLKINGKRNCCFHDVEIKVLMTRWSLDPEQVVDIFLA